MHSPRRSESKTIITQYTIYNNIIGERAFTIFPAVARKYFSDDGDGREACFVIITLILITMILRRARSLDAAAPQQFAPYEIIYILHVHSRRRVFLSGMNACTRRSRKSRLYRNNIIITTTTTTNDNNTATRVNGRTQSAAPRCGGGSITRVDKTSSPTPETRRRSASCSVVVCLWRFRYSTAATATELVRLRRLGGVGDRSNDLLIGDRLYYTVCTCKRVMRIHRTHTHTPHYTIYMTSYPDRETPIFALPGGCGVWPWYIIIFIVFVLSFIVAGRLWICGLFLI